MAQEEINKLDAAVVQALGDNTYPMSVWSLMNSLGLRGTKSDSLRVRHAMERLKMQGQVDSSRRLGSKVNAYTLSTTVREALTKKHNIFSFEDITQPTEITAWVQRLIDRVNNHKGGFALVMRWYEELPLKDGKPQQNCTTQMYLLMADTKKELFDIAREEQQQIANATSARDSSVLDTIRDELQSRKAVIAAVSGFNPACPQATSIGFEAMGINLGKGLSIEDNAFNVLNEDPQIHTWFLNALLREALDISHAHKLDGK